LSREVVAVQSARRVIEMCRASFGGERAPELSEGFHGEDGGPFVPACFR
jgi:hypothetical protein